MVRPPPGSLAPLVSVSHCLPTCALVLDGASVLAPYLPLSPIVFPHVRLWWMVRPPSRGLVSHCLPTRVLVLDGAPAFPKSCLPVSHCLPLSPRMRACVGWRARLPQDLSPIVTHGLPMVRPPPRGHASACLPLSCPSLSLFMFPFVAGGLISQFSPKGVLLAVLNAFSCV